MARNIQPIAKRCKALGISPAVMGYAKKTTNRNPGGNQMRRKKSDYATQLNEKQKVKFVYGVLERQFKNYFEMAERRPGQTGENLLAILESRLDNVVFRLGFAMTRPEARQLVSHGHVLVNGRKVNIPSYQVKPGMVIELKESSRNIARFKENVEANSHRAIPAWMQFDAEHMVGRITAVPTREDIDMPIEEHLIVELYSK